MSALLDDLAVPHNENEVGIANCLESVGDQDDCFGNFRFRNIF